MKFSTCRILLVFCLLSIKFQVFAQEVNNHIDSAFLKLQARPPLEKLYLHLDKASYNAGTTIWFSGYLLTATGHVPLAWSKFIYVELFDKADSLVYRKKVKERNGVFPGHIKLGNDLREGDYTLRAYSLWMLNSGFDYLFRKTINIRNFQSTQVQLQTEFAKQLDQNGRNDFDVQFFPEGGELIAGTSNKVAFKAIAQDGFSTAVSGFVINNNNDTICAFKSRHRGFGQVNFVPQKNKVYFVVATNPEGLTKVFSLPEVASSGAALSVLQEDNLLTITIRSASDNLQKPYYMLAHSCESKIFSQRVENLSYSIPTQNLPEGIVHFVLLDEKMHPVSSRLVFVKKKSAVELKVEPDKENYKRREAISLSVKLEKGDTLFRRGNFSISVTDDQVVNIDSLADNIRSSLLLTSDLKGHIENPAFYFSNDADSTNFYLDLLMLTQGWQRFTIENVLQNTIPIAKYSLELGQTISGKYEKMLLQRKQETLITALSIDPLISVAASTDDNGFFIFNELDFPDSTTFTIQSQRYTAIKNEPSGFIALDKDTFPPLKFAATPASRPQSLDKTFLQNTKERMYFEGEGRMIHLEEFIVTGTDKRKNYVAKYGISSDVVDEEEIAKRFRIPQSAATVIKTLSGVSVSGDQVMLSGNNAPAEILVDGMLTDLYPLSLIQSDEITDIVVIKGAGSAVYSQTGGGMGGVILIHMKKGGSFDYLPKGVLKHMPLGYQKPIEFYVPKYEVDSIRLAKTPDMRSTVYWNPNFNLDNSGQASVNFYAADPDATYTYIIEGITTLGEICRASGKIERSKR